MLTQAEVYDLFQRLDRRPQLLQPRLGRWLAWPAAKMQLLWELMYQGERAAAPSTGVWTRRLVRAGALSVALAPLGAPPPPGPEGRVLIAHVPRQHLFPDGRRRDFLCDALLEGAGLDRPVLPLAYPRLPGADLSAAAEGALSLAPLQARADLLALALMASPALGRVAAELAALVASDIPLPPSRLGNRIRLALALFEARRRLFAPLFRRLGARCLVITYAPGRMGEIAAARAAGLPVLELQHGMLGPHCPDYAWPESYRALRQHLPVADHVGLFGPVFAEVIGRSGFWTGDSVSALGAAALDRYRDLPVLPDRAPLRVLFMTQGTVRAAALAFWSAFIEEGTGEEVELLIKVHPEESAEAYRPLQARAPQRCRILPPDCNPLEEMRGADLVVAYNSMALGEALGLGRPALSLCGGAVPDGFAGTFALPELHGVMPHVREPQALAAIIRERLAEPGRRAAWGQDARRAGDRFFTPGFLPRAAARIGAMIGAAPP